MKKEINDQPCSICRKLPTVFPLSSPHIQSLYILVFQSAPILKVGYSTDVACRALHLSKGHQWFRFSETPNSIGFNFSASQVVAANCNYFVRLLEATLKTECEVFRETAPAEILDSWESWGESLSLTEVFSVSALPQMIGIIRCMKDAFPEAGYRLARNPEELFKYTGMSQVRSDPLWNDRMRKGWECRAVQCAKVVYGSETKSEVTQFP